MLFKIICDLITCSNSSLYFVSSKYKDELIILPSKAYTITAGSNNR